MLNLESRIQKRRGITEADFTRGKVVTDHGEYLSLALIENRLKELCWEGTK